MQTIKLLVYIYDKIDKMNRNFLWGDTNDKKKVHLIKWEKVCKPKSMGDFGIRVARDNSEAVNNKLGWRVINKHKPLWIKVLK